MSVLEGPGHPVRVLFLPLPGEGDFSGPDGRGDSAMMMAGSLHPPFSLFLPEEKEKTGRARSKREKEVSPLRGDVGRGSRKRCFLRVRMSSARGVVRAGVWVVDESTLFSFRCRCCRWSREHKPAAPPTAAAAAGFGAEASPHNTHAATAELDAEANRFGLLVYRSIKLKCCTAPFKTLFSFGP